MQEQIFFNNSAVRVTDAKIELSGKMYPIAHITAVKTTMQEPDRRKALAWYVLGIVLAVISVFGAANNMADIPTRILQTVEFNLFIAAPTIAISHFAIGRQKTIYRLELTTASGETESIESIDIATIRSIKNAIDKAIILRGGGNIQFTGDISEKTKVLN